MLIKHEIRFHVLDSYEMISIYKSIRGDGVEMRNNFRWVQRYSDASLIEKWLSVFEWFTLEFQEWVILESLVHISSKFVQKNVQT